MKRFTSVHDITNLQELIREAETVKRAPFADQHLGRNKTAGLIFLNPSLRTRLSSQKAAANLGMQSFVLNAGQDSWSLEFADGAVMNGSKPEHIRDAAPVMAEYCDLLAIRCFPSLQDREEDYAETVLEQFIRYCPVPVISLESATRHPLQSFADLITIHEHKPAGRRPKVVLCWAPHIKPLPQAVPNSFAEWMNAYDCDFAIANPAGYDLSAAFTGSAPVFHNKEEALRDADFVYVKNWSSFDDYGKMPEAEGDWLLKPEDLQCTRNAALLHCLPVRRNVELPDALLDSSQSLVLRQAANRVVAAQTIMKQMLQTN